MVEKAIHKAKFIKRPVFSFCISSVFVLLFIASAMWVSGFSFRRMALMEASIAREKTQPVEIDQAFSKTCYINNPTPECLNSIEPAAGDETPVEP